MTPSPEVKRYVPGASMDIIGLNNEMVRSSHILIRKSYSELLEKHQSEVKTAEHRVAAIRARAETSEKLVLKARQQLRAKNDEHQDTERRSLEATITAGSLHKK